MAKAVVFIDRRQGARRKDADPCEQLPLDLYHRKRRKSGERRSKNRNLLEDYQAFISAQGPTAPTSDSKPN